MKCFICNGELLNFKNDSYYNCNKCGHRIRKKSKNKFMVNDYLDINSIYKINFLDFFKNNILTKIDVNKNWVDIGSSSGKYLEQNKKNYKKCAGIEVSPKPYNFSKNKLKLDIYKKIEQVKFTPFLLTAWHSIEHFSELELIKFFNTLKKKTKKNCKLLISVPNNQSYQKYFFKSDYAYEDIQNHYHEFNLRSLDFFLRKYNFTRQKIFYSLPYSIFGYQQGLLNLMIYPRNYFYYRFKRKIYEFKLLKDLVNLFLFFIFIPFSLLFSLLELINLNKQSVLTVLYNKRK
jgi:DNA-directed RNA polymerase subunit RPC12/RpoP